MHDRDDETKTHAYSTLSGELCVLVDLRSLKLIYVSMSTVTASDDADSN